MKYILNLSYFEKERESKLVNIGHVNVFRDTIPLIMQSANPALDPHWFPVRSGALTQPDGVQGRIHKY